MTAAQIMVGDYVAYVDDRDEIKHIEAVKVEPDYDVVHVWSWGPRVVTFPNTYAVDIQR